VVEVVVVLVLMINTEVVVVLEVFVIQELENKQDIQLHHQRLNIEF